MDLVDIGLLFGLSILHWAIIGLFLLYYFVSSFLQDQTWLWFFDVMYIVLSTGILIQWFVFDECLISYMEKLIIVPGYQLGDRPYEHPSVFLGTGTTLQNPYVQLLMLLVWAVYALNMSFVFVRLRLYRWIGKKYAHATITAVPITFIIVGKVFIDIYNKRLAEE
jgi:hypothetical protein